MILVSGRESARNRTRKDKPMDAKTGLTQELTGRLMEIGRKMDAAGKAGDVAEMKALVTQRKNTRQALEAVRALPAAAIN
jgi:hypothetical protein